jgi:hypothetical protein
MFDSDLHIPDQLRAKPFRCPVCRRVGVTDVPRPECAGTADDLHDWAAMGLVPGRLAGEAVPLLRDDPVHGLVIR